MATTTLEDTLRAHIDNFVEGLTSIIKEAALETVREALGAGTPTRRGPGRPRKAAKKTAKKTAKRATRKAGKRGRRSTVDVAALGAQIVDYVKANPGCSVSEVGAALSLTTKDLQLPVRKLVETGKLRTTGQKRGTRYHAGSGRRSAAKKATRKKSTRKKSTRKKSTRKKSTRKKSARKSAKKSVRRKKRGKRAA